MEVKYLKVKDLIPYENNPRKNDDAVKPVMVSIQEFGFNTPILVDRNNVIIAGHTRLRAAKRLKMEEVPVIRLEELTEDQAKAYRIADNRTSEFAKWDFGLLEIEMDSIEINMDDYKMDVPEMLNRVIDDLYEIQLRDNPEVDGEKIKQGDMFQLGRHRLMCGNATNAQDVEDLLGGDTIDLVLTDPPYNVNYEGVAGKVKNDNQIESAFKEFLVQAFSHLDKHLKPGGAFYIWHPDGLSSLAFRAACADVNWGVRQCLIWNKNQATFGRSDYQWKHEPCLYGWKEGAAHYFIADRTQTTSLEYKKPMTSEAHPTMKPVDLMGRLIQNSSKKGELVVDVFAGSGSTLIAADQIGRTAYLLELEPKYIDVIIKRWEALTGQKAIKVEKGKWANEGNNNRTDK